MVSYLKYYEEPSTYYLFRDEKAVLFMVQLPPKTGNSFVGMMPILIEDNAGRRGFGEINWSKKDPYQAPEVYAQLVLEGLLR